MPAALLMQPMVAVDHITVPKTTTTMIMIMIPPVIIRDGFILNKKLRRQRQLPAYVSEAYSTSYGIDNCTFMKGGIGATAMAASAALRLERPKLKTRTEIEKKKSEYTPEVANGNGNDDNGAGNGNNNGSGNNDKNGDEDDYFNRPDEADDGNNNDWYFRTRIIPEELFDRKFVDAVLNEWQKTVMDLPPGLRQATEMGLLNSAQMVRFLAINARPTIVRNISKKLPEGVSRAFIGRMIADPAFLYKFLLDQFATIGFTWWEVKKRKHRSKQEWVDELLNVVTISACNAFVVWSLAPCRSYGDTFKYDLHNTLQKLPNNIFEKSYPLREFDMQKRIHSFLYKSAELFIFWFAAGGIQTGLSNILASKKDGRSVNTVPSLGTNALGHGFLGAFANLRHQLVCGVDRSLINHFDVIGVALFFSTGLRILNAHLGEKAKIAWVEDRRDDAKVTGDGEAPTFTKPRRKRVVRNNLVELGSSPSLRYKI